MLKFLTSSILLASVVQGFESVCRKLSVSTDISVTEDDVIKEGQPIDKWTRNAANPEIVGSNILIDYLYVTLDNHVKELEEKQIKLEFDDHFFADSTFSLESKKEGKQTRTYSIELKYRYNQQHFCIFPTRCKEYGGALIDYSLDINVPDCGQAHIFWKKICGNPLVAREGFSVDVEYHQYNQSIVRNGALVDASYFDKDLDNYVFQVPSGSNSTTFYLRMDLDTTKEIGDDQKTKDFFQKVEKSEKSEPEEENNDSEFQILEAILKMIPEVKISSPVVDADQAILNPRISGELANGGIVTDEAQTIVLDYNCISPGNTTIELSIPLDYFKDINLIFVKQCLLDDQGGSSTTNSRQSPIIIIQFQLISGSSFFGRLFQISIVLTISYILYNLVVKQRSLSESTLFMFTFVWFIRQVNNYITINEQFISPQQQTEQKYGRGYNTANEEDYESEFKVEKFEQNSGTYGSI